MRQNIYQMVISICPHKGALTCLMAIQISKFNKDSITEELFRQIHLQLFLKFQMKRIMLAHKPNEARHHAIGEKWSNRVVKCKVDGIRELLRKRQLD